MNASHLLLISASILTILPSFAATSPPMAYGTSFNALAKQCSSGVHPNTLQAIARVESNFNPYAIGVVKGGLKRQPRNLAEAIGTARSLHAQGKNFSMGLMQINRYNLARYGLNYETVFNPCKNINVGAQILKSCFDRAGGNGQVALKKAFSCYYSGNFTFGFKSDFKGQPPYVTKVILAALDNSPQQDIHFSGSLKKHSNLHKASYVPSLVSHDTQAEKTKEQQSAVVIPKQQAKWDIFKEF